MTKHLLWYIVLCLGLVDQLASLHAQDGKFYAFFAIDTEASKVGADVTPGCLAAKSRFETIMAEIFADKESRYQQYNITGDQISPDVILPFFENQLRVNRNDTIWFFYGGHGATDRDEGHFLATSRGNISRRKLRAALEKTNARNIVITTDACSSPGVFNYLPKRRSPAEWKAFEQLFFQHRGVTDITAATAPQFAWTNSKDGGFFSQALARMFCEPVDALDSNQDGFVSWDEASKYLQYNTRQTFLDARANNLRHDPDAKIGQSSSQDPEVFQLATTDRPQDGPLRYTKLFRVVNNNSETLCLWVRGYVDTGDKGYSWAPVFQDAWYYEIEPGKSTFLSVNGVRLNAHAIQLWASTSKFKWPKELVVLAPKEGYRSHKEQVSTYLFNNRFRYIESINVRQTHNVVRNGSKGVLFSLAMDTHGFKETPLKVSILFFDRDGSPLRDLDGIYAASNGDVGVGAPFTPPYLHTRYSHQDDDGIELFMPYGQLHLGQGEFQLGFKVNITSGSETVFRADRDLGMTYSSSP